jgi:transposase
MNEALKRAGARLADFFTGRRPVVIDNLGRGERVVGQFEEIHVTGAEACYVAVKAADGLWYPQVWPGTFPQCDKLVRRFTATLPDQPETLVAWAKFGDSTAPRPEKDPRFALPADLVAYQVVAIDEETNPFRNACGLRKLPAFVRKSKPVLVWRRRS